MTKQAEPATLDDLPSLVDVIFSAFNSPSSIEAFPATPEGREFMRQYYEMSIKSEPGLQQTKVLVVRDESGKVISCAMYYIVRPGDGGFWPWRKRFPELRPGMSERTMDSFFTLMMEQQNEILKDEPHVCLEMIGTHQAHRKQGCASALLSMGNELADELDYLGFINAASGAKHLYEQLGYIAYPEHKKANSWPMVRKKKSDQV